MRTSSIAPPARTSSRTARVIGRLGWLAAAVLCGASCSVAHYRIPDLRPPDGIVDRRAEFQATFDRARPRWEIPDELPHDTVMPLHPPVTTTTGITTRRTGGALRDADATPADVASPTLAPTSVAVLIARGFLGDTVGYPFGPAGARLHGLGYHVQDLPMAGAASTAHNAALIAQAVGAVQRPHVIMIGHSKGVPDILRFLVDYPAAGSRVVAVLGIAGAVHGSPLADDVPCLAPDALLVGLPLLMLSPTRCGDGGGLDSLQPAQQRRWVLDHPLPSHVRYYTIVTVPEPAQLSVGLRLFHDALADRTTASADLRPLNDGLVAFADQFIPGSTLLAVANVDHVGVVYGKYDLPLLLRLVANRTKFPRSALLEAAIAFIARDVGIRARTL